MHTGDAPRMNRAAAGPHKSTSRFSIGRCRRFWHHSFRALGCWAFLSRPRAARPPGAFSFVRRIAHDLQARRAERRIVEHPARDGSLESGVVGCNRIVPGELQADHRRHQICKLQSHVVRLRDREERRSNDRIHREPSHIALEEVSDRLRVPRVDSVVPIIEDHARQIVRAMAFHVRVDAFEKEAEGVVERAAVCCLKSQDPLLEANASKDRQAGSALRAADAAACERYSASPATGRHSPSHCSTS